MGMAGWVRDAAAYRAQHAPRVIRYVLVACACLGVIFLFLLATASANTALFARSYDLLLVLNGTMVAVLMGKYAAVLPGERLYPAN